MRLISCALASALLLTACSANPGQAASGSSTAAAAVHPVSGLKVVPLTVTHMGKAHTFRVEVAGTEEEQAKGLMFRTEMGADEGMIFPMDPPRGASFWMRNTVISLDIIFVGTDGRISNIAANAIPYNELPLPSVGLVKGVLELGGGRAAQLGIVAGDKVAW
ncbi:MAG TPA: DUF192 domain-containing protein [Novosphingobium sp.]|nr:DUF192 domain-containing protein [Novosphingobium sp.]